MVDERTQLTRHVLDVAYNTLTRLNNYGHHLTLIGAYSIFRQLKTQYHKFDENSRTTEDLDFTFTIYHSMKQITFVFREL